MKIIGSLFHILQSCLFSGFIEERIRLTTAPVSKTIVAVRIMIVVDPYDKRSLYGGFDIRTISHPCKGNADGSAIENAYLRDFANSFIFAAVLGKRNYSGECVSVVAGSCSTGGDFSINCTTGGAGVARCTFRGQVIIMRVLVRVPCCPSCSEQIRRYGFNLFEIRRSSVLKMTVLCVHNCGRGYS